MKVLLWELGDTIANIVLWDGENTYWTDEMKPSSGYTHLKMGFDDSDKTSRFTLIGEL